MHAYPRMMQMYDIAALMQGCQMAYFQTKIQICVNFGGPWNGKGWYVL
jgi:hypothetical protein